MHSAPFPVLVIGGDTVNMIPIETLNAYRRMPMKQSRRMRRPPGRMLSMSGQAAETRDASTDLTTSERPLDDYVAEVSERTDVRVGVPLPLGTYARGEGVNFAFSS